MKIYEVGGKLRDEILGLQSKDADYCVICQSYEEMRDHILAKGGKIYLERPEYFAIRCKFPGIGDADFVLGRNEGFYSDSRRPDSVSVASCIEEELKRRDFTCNAMARDIKTGKIVDPFNGAWATKAKQLICVGDTESRMREDSLRALRAVRFSITKGFALSLELEDFLLQKQNADLLDAVSVERMMEEMKKCFAFNTLATLSLLHRFHNLETAIFRRNLILTPTIVAQ